MISGSIFPDFFELLGGFLFRFFGVPDGPTFGKEGNLKKNNKKEEKKKEKGTVQDREQCCRTLTRLSGAAQAWGGSQLPAAILPLRALES